MAAKVFVRCVTFSVYIARCERRLYAHHSRCTRQKDVISNINNFHIIELCMCAVSGVRCRAFFLSIDILNYVTSAVPAQ